MNFRKKLLTGIGALAFMVLMALNVQVVQNPASSDQSISDLALIELAAEAQLDVSRPDDLDIDWGPHAELCSSGKKYYTYCQIGGKGCVPTFCF